MKLDHGEAPPHSLPQELRPADLAIIEDNAYLCSVVTFDDNRGRPGYRRSPVLLKQPEATEPSLGLFRYLRWARSEHRKLIEASCVIPNTKEANDFAEAYFLRLTDAQLRGDTDSRVQATWNGDIVNCTFDTWTGDVECGGELCIYWPTMIVGAEAAQKVAAYTYEYVCGNGCTIYDFSGYVCPGDGGSGDTHNGTGGGGPGVNSGNPEEYEPPAELDDESIEAPCEPPATTPCTLYNLRGDSSFDFVLAEINRMRFHANQECRGMGNKALELWNADNIKGYNETVSMTFGPYQGLPIGGDYHDGQIHLWTDEERSQEQLLSALRHESWHAMEYPIRSGELVAHAYAATCGGNES